MANNKVKFALFGTVVVVAVVLVIALVVHRSLNRDRLCKGNFLYYEDPGTNEGSCQYQAGQRGPCGHYMVLVKDSKNGTQGVGVCECDIKNSTRTLIYHEDTNQCYYIFTQAFCEEGMWLTILKGQEPRSYKAICDTRTCPEREVDDPGNEMVPLSDGRCVELDKYDNVTCNSSQTVQFYRKQKYPSCKRKPVTVSTSNVGGVANIDCPDGYFSTGVGHCQPDFDFD